MIEFDGCIASDRIPPNHLHHPHHQLPYPPPPFYHHLSHHRNTNAAVAAATAAVTTPIITSVASTATAAAAIASTSVINDSTSNNHNNNNNNNNSNGLIATHHPRLNSLLTKSPSATSDINASPGLNMHTNHHHHHLHHPHHNPHHNSHHFSHPPHPPPPHHVHHAPAPPPPPPPPHHPHAPSLNHHQHHHMNNTLHGGDNVGGRKSNDRSHHHSRHNRSDCNNTAYSSSSNNNSNSSSSNHKKHSQIVSKLQQSISSRLKTTSSTSSSSSAHHVDNVSLPISSSIHDGRIINKSLPQHANSSGTASSPSLHLSPLRSSSTSSSSSTSDSAVASTKSKLSKISTIHESTTDVMAASLSAGDGRKSSNQQENTASAAAAAALKKKKKSHLSRDELSRVCQDGDVTFEQYNGSTYMIAIRSQGDRKSLIGYRCDWNSCGYMNARVERMFGHIRSQHPEAPTVKKLVTTAGPTGTTVTITTATTTNITTTTTSTTTTTTATISTSSNTSTINSSQSAAVSARLSLRSSSSLSTASSISSSSSCSLSPQSSYPKSSPASSIAAHRSAQSPPPAPQSILPPSDCNTSALVTNHDSSQRLNSCEPGSSSGGGGAGVGAVTPLTKTKKSINNDNNNQAVTNKSSNCDVDQPVSLSDASARTTIDHHMTRKMDAPEMQAPSDELMIDLLNQTTSTVHIKAENDESELHSHQHHHHHDQHNAIMNLDLDDIKLECPDSLSDLVSPDRFASDRLNYDSSNAHDNTERKPMTTTVDDKSTDMIMQELKTISVHFEQTHDDATNDDNLTATTEANQTNLNIDYTNSDNLHLPQQPQHQPEAFSIVPSNNSVDRNNNHQLTNGGPSVNECNNNSNNSSSNSSSSSGGGGDSVDSSIVACVNVNDAETIDSDRQVSTVSSAAVAAASSSSTSTSLLLDDGNCGGGDDRVVAPKVEDTLELFDDECIESLLMSDHQPNNKQADSGYHDHQHHSDYQPDDSFFDIDHKFESEQPQPQQSQSIAPDDTSAFSSQDHVPMTPPSDERAVREPATMNVDLDHRTNSSADGDAFDALANLHEYTPYETMQNSSSSGINESSSLDQYSAESLGDDHKTTLMHQTSIGSSDHAIGLYDADGYDDICDEIDAMEAAGLMLDEGSNGSGESTSVKRDRKKTGSSKNYIGKQNLFQEFQSDDVAKVRDSENKYIIALQKNMKIVGYRCDWPECEFLTCRKYVMVNHINGKHTNQRPYSCPLCNFNFVKRYFLKAHMHKVHKRRISLDGKDEDDGPATARKRDHDHLLDSFDDSQFDSFDALDGVSSPPPPPPPPPPPAQASSKKSKNSNNNSKANRAPPAAGYASNNGGYYNGVADPSSFVSSAYGSGAPTVPPQPLPPMSTMNADFLANGSDIPPYHTIGGYGNGSSNCYPNKTVPATMNGAVATANGNCFYPEDSFTSDMTGNTGSGGNFKSNTVFMTPSPSSSIASPLPFATGAAGSATPNSKCSFGPSPLYESSNSFDCGGQTASSMYSSNGSNFNQTNHSQQHFLTRSYSQPTPPTQPQIYVGGGGLSKSNSLGSNPTLNQVDLLTPPLSNSSNYCRGSSSGGVTQQADPFSASFAAADASMTPSINNYSGANVATNNVGCFDDFLSPPSSISSSGSNFSSGSYMNNMCADQQQPQQSLTANNIGNKASSNSNNLTGASGNANSVRQSVQSSTLSNTPTSMANASSFYLHTPSPSPSSLSHSPASGVTTTGYPNNNNASTNGGSYSTSNQTSATGGYASNVPMQTSFNSTFVSDTNNIPINNQQATQQQSFIGVKQQQPNFTAASARAGMQSSYASTPSQQQQQQQVSAQNTATAAMYGANSYDNCYFDQDSNYSPMLSNVPRNSNKSFYNSMPTGGCNSYNGSTNIGANNHNSMISTNGLFDPYIGSYGGIVNHSAKQMYPHHHHHHHPHADTNMSAMTSAGGAAAGFLPNNADCWNASW